MDIVKIVNVIGIILTMLGVYTVYYNSPINFTIIDGGNASTDFKKIERQKNRRNRFVTYGVYLVLLGSFAQIISNFLPVESVNLYRSTAKTTNKSSEFHFMVRFYPDTISKNFQKK
jgi:hypothetical protein